MRLRQLADVEQVYETGGRPIAAGKLPKDELMRLIKDLESQMKKAAKDLEFEKAAALRDEVVELRGLMVLQDGPSALDAAGDRMEKAPRTSRRAMRRRRGI
jgi:excinuclease ABC subunit B